MVNDVPVRETGHNLHAPSPQEAEVKKSIQLEVIRKIKQNQKLVPVRFRLKFIEFRQILDNML